MLETEEERKLYQDLLKFINSHKVSDKHVLRVLSQLIKSFKGWEK